ncbi:MAG: Lnb N-terminal periplasmic domain-containing protein [Candidatus Cyclobacteriaceae bacterium M3_2C_046]
MKYLFLLISLLFAYQLAAQNFKLSSRAEISLLTYYPGQELYQRFGHSALRVKDPGKGLDRVYNYGSFDFDSPNFYLKFARGKLHYWLSVSSFARFQLEYIYNQQRIVEQVLNLNREQRDVLFNFLQENYKYENRFYFYDFFYDNCTTRIRDALDQLLSLSYHLDIPEKMTFREAIDPYLQPAAWANLGIDVALGAPTDKVMNASEYLFLPLNLKNAYDKALIINGVYSKPLVAETRILNTGKLNASIGSPLPSILLIIILVLVMGFTLVELKQHVHFFIVDLVWFTLTGLLGIFLLTLWLATDHQATAYNLDLLWAWPTHLALLFLAYKPKALVNLHRYFLALLILSMSGLVFMLISGINFSPTLIPLWLITGLRAGRIYSFYH